MSVVKKTKTNFPQGVAYRILEILRTKNKPKDVTAKIKMKKVLEKVKFGYANDYHKDVMSVTERYDVSISETELIEIMATQVNNLSYVDMIVNHLKASTADDLEELCKQISKNQRLSEVSGAGNGVNTNKNLDRKEKEVQLMSTDFKGICGFCHKKAGHKRKDCPEQKKKAAELKCSSCGKSGHLEANCWKAHPKKAPQWVKDAKSKEASGVEITLASMEILNDEGLDFGRVTL